MRVLIVTSDPKRFAVWIDFLERNGVAVASAAAERRAIARATGEDPIDVVLLDGSDRSASLELVRETHVRLHVGIPVAFIAVVPSEAILSLVDSGLDDILDDAAASEEVLYRIRRVAARRPPRRFELGSLTICPAEGRATLASRALRLTRREFDLLAALAMRPGHTFRREDLLTAVWGPAFRGSSKVVDICVSRLRGRLRGFAGSVEAVLGIGYRLVVRDASADADECQPGEEMGTGSRRRRSGVGLENSVRPTPGHEIL
jgi:DNA-binding response OmpR family regulator